MLSKVKHKHYTNDIGRPKDSRQIQVIMVTFIFLLVNIDNKNRALLYGTIFVFFKSNNEKRSLIYYYNRKNL